MSTRVLVAVSLLAAASMAFAAGGTGAPKGANVSQGSHAPGPNTKEKGTGTWDAVGNGESASLPQFAFTTVASSIVKCGSSGGCSIGIEAMAQMQTGGADWAICLLVDGGTTSCQYQGVQSGPSSFVVGNARGWASGVSQGKHTVELQLYTESASATYQYFQMDSHVYTP